MTAALEHAALGQRRTLDCDGQFETLYRRYEGDVYKLALQLVRGPEDAEDVTQIAFLNAYRALARGNSPRKPRSWLFAIARNVCAKRFQAQQRRPREVQLLPEIFEARADGDGTTVDELRSALQTLSFEQRSALVLREFLELSYAEIAARLGVSVAAVETMLFRARRSLRSELEKADVTPSIARTAEKRKPRTLGALLPWPAGLGKPFGWLASFGRGGLGLKAAGIAAASVVGTSAGVGIGAVPLVRFPAETTIFAPADSLRLTAIASRPTVPAARMPAARPSSWSEPEATIVPERTPAEARHDEARSLPVVSPQLADPSLQTPALPEAAKLETPSPTTPELPELPPLEVPSVPAPTLPEPPPLEPPSLPTPALPEPPELETPSIPAPPPPLPKPQLP